MVRLRPFAENPVLQGLKVRVWGKHSHKHKRL